MDLKITRFDADVDLYTIGKCILLPALFLGFWFAYKGYDLLAAGNICVFRHVTGLPCPGCGGTRAVVFLFKGKFLKSFLYNPVVIYIALAYLHFMGLFFTRLHITNTINEKPIRVRRYFYVLIAVLLIQWIAKLIVIFIK